MKNKIKKLIELEALCETLRNNGKKIVFTNGCFDIIHKGHVLYLHEAKTLGDKLIVGLNSDASVKRLKGESRPVNTEDDRAIVLAALESVDHICIFEEDTPYNLIDAIKPNILVKGGDWKIEEIVGSDIVTANKGKVYSLSFHDGYSSTKIIKKLEKDKDADN